MYNSKLQIHKKKNEILKKNLPMLTFGKASPSVFLTENQASLLYSGASILKTKIKTMLLN